MKKQFLYPALIFFILTAFLSCRKDTVYENFIPVPEAWNSRNVVNFHVNISDTVHAENVFISVRHSGKYEFSNLYLFVTAQSPNGNIKRDTIELVLADGHGKWLGKGAASMFTLYYPYKSNIRFPMPGIYTFSIEQAMWVKDLKNVSDVGLMIEKAGSPK